jgi:hypothetical protein
MTHTFFRSGGGQPKRPGRGRVADHQQVHVAALDGAAEVLQAHVRRHLGAVQQVEVALPRVRLEVGVVDAVHARRVADRHDLAVEAGRHAEPVHAVVAGHRLVTVPAFRIGALAGVEEAHRARFALRALQAEVEPLPDVGVRILAYIQFDGAGACGADDIDGASIELAADFDRHGKSCIEKNWREPAMILEVNRRICCAVSKT